MNLEKIGKFIAERRKMKELTQLQLAEALYVTDKAVSKWENGRSLPDSSIMLNLCKCLDITIIDLLNGEIVNMDNYEKEMEANLLRMIKEKEETDKFLLKMEYIFGIPITVFTINTIMFACISPKLDAWVRIIIIVACLTIIGFIVAFTIRVEQKAGYYECPNCNKRYVPTYKSVLMSFHVNYERLMKCPYCNKRGWHKKVISQNKN